MLSFSVLGGKACPSIVCPPDYKAKHNSGRTNGCAAANGQRCLMLSLQVLELPSCEVWRTRNESSRGSCLRTYTFLTDTSLLWNLKGWTIATIGQPSPSLEKFSHRLVEVGRDHRKSSSPSYCSKQACPEPCSEFLQGWGLYNLSG